MTPRCKLKNIIYAYIPEGTKTITTDSNQVATIPFDTVLIQKGTGLTLKNGKIVVGKGIKTVKIKVDVNLNTTNQSIMGVLIQRNNYATIHQKLIQFTNENKTYNSIQTELILNVAEGDTLYADIRTVAYPNKDVVINGGRLETHIEVEQFE